jgi:hypothetical protein
MKRSPLAIIGWGFLGAISGVIVSAAVSFWLAASWFDSDMEAAKARVQASQEARRAAEANARRPPGKGVTDAIAIGAGNAVADGLSPAAEATALLLLRVVMGTIAGLVVGTISGFALAILLPSRAASASVA